MKYVKEKRMRVRLQVLVTLIALGGCTAFGQGALNPRASYVDVTMRRAELKTASARVQEAVKALGSCSVLAPVEAPVGPIKIPMHYLHGGHGPTNPAEHAATVPYALFEKRVTTGMNRFLALGDLVEARCAQDQIDVWARAGALLDYDASEQRQSWYQVEWTLGAVAISESVLVNDTWLDKQEVARDLEWMNKVAHRMTEFQAATTQRNNHYYWRGLGALATGTITGDRKLFDYGVQAFKDAVNEIDERGAFPQEMARSERSIHYQAFALQPLLPIAELAERQGVPLYAYKSKSGKTIADAIEFLGKAVADPGAVKPYTQDEQLVDSDAPDFFAAIEFYTHRFPERKLPAAIAEGLKKPTYATRLGGSTTAIAGR
ncbi:MAG: alginate lyase family protein [Terracidiphilus sp.]|nr:alginate lyase family protein [Terracidiphilus sp.]